MRRWPMALWAGMALISIVLLIGLLAPLLVRFPFDELHLGDRFTPPSGAYWFGTDEFGRDVFSRVLTGTWASLFFGVGATAIAIALGIPLGILAGHLGGFADEAVMRPLDILMSFPPIILAMLMLAMTEPGIVKTVIVVGVVYTPTIARITRSSAITISKEAYVEAAGALGASTMHKMVRHILPNVIPTISVEATIQIGFCILLAAALSFVGLGAQPPSSDWGLMISDARPYVLRAPWVAIFPGIFMGVTVVGFNLLGDGLRELLDPRASHGRR